MKATRASIESFLANRKIAVAGVSQNPKKFGHVVFKTLTDKGFEIFPINPSTDIIASTPCFRNVSALPVNVHNLLVLTSKKNTLEVVSEAIRKGIDHIWIQQGSETREAVELITAHKINLISGECILMHTDPVKGIHKFHRTIMKLFGLLPK